MDLAAMVPEIRDLTGIDMETIRTDDRIKQDANQAYKEIWISEERWAFLNHQATIATVNGTAAYTLPAALASVTGVVILTGTARGDLRERLTAELDQVEDSDIPDQGRPTEYVFRRPSAIELWPTPDAVYTVTVRGRRAFAALAGDTDEPIFDEEFHEIVPLVAAANIMAIEGDDSGRRQEYMARAENIQRLMYRRYQLDQDEAPVQLGGRWDAHRGRYLPDRGRGW